MSPNRLFDILLNNMRHFYMQNKLEVGAQLPKDMICCYMPQLVTKELLLVSKEGEQFCELFCAKVPGPPFAPPSIRNKCSPLNFSEETRACVLTLVPNVIFEFNLFAALLVESILFPSFDFLFFPRTKC